MISENYRALNEKLHRQQHAYGCSGSRWADLVLELARGRDLFDALDYGCGKQTLAGMIGHVIPIRGYDPAIPHLSERPAPADLVTCTDVMEHVEPEHIDAVLDDVASLARKAAFFVISLERGGRKLPDGRYAHLSVHPAEWWMRKLEARFADIEEFPQRAKTAELVVLAHAR
jgi:predicted TPR repeat methyltransferase